MNLVFYDGECGLCDRTVNFILRKDKEKKFVFAPLQGETAKKKVPQYANQLDTLVLIEDYQTNPKTYIMGKAAFRICWLLGGWWKAIGWISFLPSFLYDWGYRLIARNRKKLFDSCPVNTNTDHSRFLE